MRGFLVDPATIEVIRGALVFACEEMGISLRNSAYSPNIKERMDHSCAIFDQKRRLVAQAEHIPVHLGSMAWGVRQSLEHFAQELEEGDMVLCNDPYISGTHLPDITLIAPVFYNGEIIGYAANKAHHSDVGGRVPGSMAGDSRELYEEGLIVPPVKFVRHGKINDDVAGIILANVRTPETRIGDLRAQMAANIVGKKRILELVDRYGVEIVHEAMDEVMNHAERLTRAAIKKMPQKLCEAEDYLDDSGIGAKPVKIKAAISIDEDTIRIDYAGTDRQVDGPLNAPWGVTISGAYYAVKCVTDPSIPTNDGSFRPIEINAPEGSVVNPTRPAPVAGGNVETSQRNVDVLLKAFSEILPRKVCAACQGTMNNVSVGGTDPRTGKPWSFYETMAGGFGGRYGSDGVDAIHSHMTNTMNTPIEAIEPVCPFRFTSYQMRIDSGGPGKWRGGVGLERSWVLEAPSAILSILAERNRLPPWGLFRGKPGATGEYYLTKANGKKTRLRSKCTVNMRKGERLTVRTPGGGGYGNPLEREPRMVLNDVTNELVSIKSAKSDYGVVIRPTLVIDEEETKRLRKKMRHEHASQQ
jgi:N-methylhydantoinase B